MYDAITRAKLAQIIRLRLPTAGPRKLPVHEVGDPHVRDRRHALCDVVPVVELEEEVAGDTERQEVDRGSADDLVGSQVDCEVRVHERHQPPGRAPDEQADQPSCRPCPHRRRPRTRPSASSPRGRCSRRRCARRTCRRSHRTRAASRTRTSVRSSAALKTAPRFPVPERVASTPSPMPISPAATAPYPSRRRPRLAVQTPSTAATTPTTIGQVIVRASIGGMARNAAKTPSTRPA